MGRFIIGGAGFAGAVGFAVPVPVRDDANLCGESAVKSITSFLWNEAGGTPCDLSFCSPVPVPVEVPVEVEVFLFGIITFP